MGLHVPGAVHLPDDDSDGDDDAGIMRPSGPTCAWCC